MYICTAPLAHMAQHSPSAIKDRCIEIKLKPRMFGHLIMLKNR